MADKGRWVRVPGAHAQAGPGFELQNLWGRETLGERFFGSNWKWDQTDDAARYQMPDGSLRMTDPSGKYLDDSIPIRTVPLWSPPPRQGNHVSKFAGARDANLRRINRDPRFAAPAARPPAPAPAAPGADALEQAGAVVSGLQQQYFSGPPLIAETPSVYVQPTPDQEIAIRNLAPGAAPAAAGVMDDAQLNQRRRSAFLDAKDSMSGLAAVRGLLSEQAQARGADLSGGGPIPSVRFLEAQLAKTPARQSITKTADLPEADQQVWGQMAFENQPITQVVQGAGGAVMEPPATATPAVSGGGLAPEQIAQAGFAAQEQIIPSGAPRAAVNGYMQSALKEKLRATQQPLNEVAQWQLTPQPIQAPRTEPGREAALAAFAARREQPPTTEGMGLLAAGAGNAFGTRGGQFKPGNTVNLGFVDASKLPPLNSAGFYAGVRLNPGNF